MQDNWRLYRTHPKDSRYSASVPANSASIDPASMFIGSGIPVSEHCSSTVAPTTKNRSGSLTDPLGVTENVDYSAYACTFPAPPNVKLAGPLMNHAYSSEAHFRLWQCDAEGVASYARVPHAGWNETSTQLERSQVPSERTDLDILGQSWSQCGRDGHAVDEALTQPALWRDTRCTPYSLPNRLHMPALPDPGASHYAHIACLGNVNPCVADPVPCPAPSHTNSRQHRRPPHPRAEVVTCDSCLKSMRRQSLKRHVREVHHHIKRPHPKSNSAAQSRP